MLRDRSILLAREREILQTLRHPGVVELLGVEEGAEGPVLLTAPVDAPSLARLPALSVEEVAGIVAALASTLADLHDLGFVHGGLAAEQVLVGADGHPVLRGFGHGGRTGEPPVVEPAAPAGALDPARAEGDPLDPATDVFALGALIRALLDAAGDARGDRVRRATADALRSMAERAMAADPRLRLSARALADAVRHAVPGARLPRRSTPPSPGSAQSEPARPAAALRRPALSPLPPRRRRSWLLAGVAAVAGTIAGVAAVAGTGPGPTPPSPSTSVPATTSGTVVAESTTPRPRTPVTAAPPRDCPGIDAVLSADVDGDGCPEALRWADGILDAGGRRWAVGERGDLVATGDWSCRRSSTLALLHPATGDVFVFERWARPGEEVVATPVTRVDGGFALRTGDLDGDGCPELLVDRRGGPPVRVLGP